MEISSLLATIICVTVRPLNIHVPVAIVQITLLFCFSSVLKGFVSSFSFLFIQVKSGISWPFYESSLNSIVVDLNCNHGEVLNTFEEYPSVVKKVHNVDWLVLAGWSRNSGAAASQTTSSVAQWCYICLIGHFFSLLCCLVTALIQFYNFMTFPSWGIYHSIFMGYSIRTKFCFDLRSLMDCPCCYSWLWCQVLLFVPNLWSLFSRSNVLFHIMWWAVMTSTLSTLCESFDV